MNDELRERLNTLWNDPETGLSSLTQFHRTVKQLGVNISMKQLKEWYDGKSVNQITKKPQRKPQSFIPIQCPVNVECLQADLMDISKYSASNSNYNYLFNVLHLNTRFMWSFPIKHKSPNDIVEHMESVIKLVRVRTPNNEITVTTDDGSEFMAAFATLLERLNVKHYTSVDTNNTANIERFHRTLWGYINKYATAKNTLKFVPVLPQLISKYNNAVNRSIKTTPLQLWDGVALTKKKTVALRRKKPKSRLKIGDHVRFLIKLATFDKRSFKNMYSTNVYTIKWKKGNRYVLSNDAEYLARELQRVDDDDEPVEPVEPVVAVAKNKPQKNLGSLETQIDKVTRKRRTVRRNRKDFTGDEVERVDEQVVYKPRLRPSNAKRGIKTPARFRSTE